MPPTLPDVLQPIYSRIEEKRKSKDPRYVRAARPMYISDKERTDYACRMYEEYMEKHPKTLQAIRQKYSRPEVQSTKHNQMTMQNMADRLCPKPPVPSILEQILKSKVTTSSTTGSSTASSATSASEKTPTSPTKDNEDSYEDDFCEAPASPTKSSQEIEEEDELKQQRELLRVTLASDKLSVKTFLARHEGSVLRELAKPHRLLPPPGETELSKLPGYDSWTDPHLVWYWKSRVKHEKQRKIHAGRDRERWLREIKKKEASYQRLQRLRPYYRPLFVLPHLQKEKLFIEEARARVFLKMLESDARKDIKKLFQITEETSAENTAMSTSPTTANTGTSSSGGTGSGSEQSTAEDEAENYSDDYDDYDYEDLL